MGRAPERTCVGCRSKAPKASLVRVVVADGKLTADPAARMPGRGAHVHPDAACVQLAVHKGSLGRALRATISAEELSNLLAELRPKGTTKE